MKKNLEVLDTNIIVRFLTNDNEEQVKVIENLFRSSKPKTLYIPDLVIAEIIYVLQSYYEIPKKDVIAKMNTLVEYDKFFLDSSLIRKSLEIFNLYNISFVDAYLLALMKQKDIKKIHTFDKNVLKISNPKPEI